MAEFEYFYGQEADLFSFIRVPKLLFTDSRFRSVSNDAKILYGFLLDRMSLSVESNWFDAYGRVYIIFTIAEIINTLGCANTKACNTLQQLVDAGLVEKINKGQGKAQLLYVKKILSDYSKPRVKDTTRKPSPTQDSESQNSENENSQNESPRITVTGTQEFQKPECINTEKTNTDFINTENNSISSNLIKIYPPEYKGDETRKDEKDKDKLSEITKVMESVTEKIDVEGLKQRFPYNQPLIDQITKLMVDVISDDVDYYVIGGARKNPELVKDQFKNLDYSHVAYVIDSLKSNTTKVRNIRQYLIAALYNAPLTIDAHYESEVNHDMSRGIFFDTKENEDEQRNSICTGQPKGWDR
ncbi:DUF6017 domain-containing protein [Butyrivibrio sp. INlla16]|uniref:DUF6017 domain-containing protein n=1 Tax=Butyrivibrio sp. INlla16 TaxID=1520807 RepID=UPI000884A387|nr:DUF6017 domain-containing protein [Butyrivibrio sp. INlla16]SDB12909.1 Replication initiator protein A (RepA) N-terminus [Butyrivibrio sp. INlla16]